MEYLAYWALNYNASLELRALIFQDAKITFKTDKNQNSFNFSEDHNNIYDHKYHTDPGNWISI